MKKPEIKSKIKLEAVFGLILLVSLVAGGLYVFSMSEPSEPGIATTTPTNDDQPTSDEDSQTDENTENSGSEPVPGASGIAFALPILNSGSNFETFYGQEPVYNDVSAVDSSDDDSETPSNSETTDDEQETDNDDSDSGEIQIIETDDGFILVDADGNEINIEDIPEDILHDLEDLFPDLFIGNDDSGLNDYPEADEEVLDPDDVEYGDDDGFADDDVGEETDDETSDDETQDETEDETDDETGIDSGDDEIGEVIDVDPLDDLEEFPEDVPDDLPNDDWLDDWING